jgi:plasmid replication initiation protein
MSRLIESIERLMQTIVVARGADGVELRLQLLGTNTISTSPNSGELTYSFPPRLAGLVRDSSIFAKLDHAVMQSFSSKYAFALYEAISRRVRLRHVFTEKFSIENLRDLLGVEKGKLDLYKNLKSKAIDPALIEVNALTPYNVTIQTHKNGRRVVGFSMGWGLKDQAGMRQAYAEMKKSRIGRKERLNNAPEDEVITDNSLSL